MIYTDFKGKKLSKLGLGCMRFPLLEDKSIDVGKVREMVKTAIEGGVNYFDTAYAYHEGKSETVIGEILKEYPRDSYYLATKYPGHQFVTEYDPKGVFEEQLKKCGVEYFDFYLLHNVCENSDAVYRDPKWGIIDYFISEHKAGRIKHLGFSCHGRPDYLEAFLKDYGKDLEFCQIQLNYLDWTLQDAKTKCEILNRYNMPIWVMEPVRGGKLANVPAAIRDRMRQLQPDWSPAEWCFRFLMGVKGVQMILSGMTTLEQIQENVKTFQNERKLDAGEEKALFNLAEEMKNAIPCTACRYCTKGCPMELDIPLLISLYNDAKISKTAYTVSMALDSMPEDKQPDACIGCGACESICPQNIHVPKIMREFAELKKELPNWAKVCREREEAAKRMQEV